MDAAIWFLSSARALDQESVQIDPLVVQKGGAEGRFQNMCIRTRNGSLFYRNLMESAGHQFCSQCRISTFLFSFFFFFFLI